MRRMYSQSQLEQIVRNVAVGAHVYSLYKDEGTTDAGSQTTVYFVSDKNIANASDLTAENINGKVISVSYYEWKNGSYSDKWMSLGSFVTDSNGKVKFYRIKQRDDIVDQITDVNITLTVLKTYTLTKLV